MKRRIYGIIIIACFIAITIFQYKISYDFRIKAPSEVWSKEVLISEGKMKVNNVPKLVNYRDGFVVAHDDGNRVKVISLDKLGKKEKEIIITGEDDSIKDLNLLTDGEYLYVNWATYKNGIESALIIKLDNKFNEVERWTKNDIKELAQVGESVLVTAYNNRIEVQDFKTNQVASVNTPSPSKLSGTITNFGDMVTYYVPFKAGVREISGFFYFYFMDGTITEPVNIMERPLTSSEIFFGTATACDDKNGYILVERKNKMQYSSNVFITFPLGSSPSDKSNEKTGVERVLDIMPTDQFIYSPATISSGEEARFVVGYARKYGRTAKQFNLLDFSYKDGKVVKSNYITRTRQASNQAYTNGENIVYSSLKKADIYEIYLSSSNKEFITANNGIRNEEIKLAIIDIIQELMNAVFSLFIYGISWIVPGVVLIAILTMIGYKLSVKLKRLAFILICTATTLFKLLSVNHYYYKIFAKDMPTMLSSAGVGIGIAFLLSLLCYLFGTEIYFNKLKKDEFVFPFIIFAIALIIDSLLTQFVFTPFIM